MRPTLFLKHNFFLSQGKAESAVKKIKNGLLRFCVETENRETDENGHYAPRIQNWHAVLSIVTGRVNATISPKTHMSPVLLLRGFDDTSHFSAHDHLHRSRHLTSKGYDNAVNTVWRVREHESTKTHTHTQTPPPQHNYNHIPNLFDFRTQAKFQVIFLST